jgi:hypothetical protein
MLLDVRSYRPVEQETFVIRLWRESSSQTWRGEIVHLPDQAGVHFASLRQAAAFVRRYLPGLASPTSRRAEERKLAGYGDE